MKMFKEVTLTGIKHGRKFTADIRWNADQQRKPIVLFLHGFKGFKDWGTFPAIADIVRDAGFIVVKMNMSHNGVTPENPIDFADLDAFSNNTFSIELDDVAQVVDFIHTGEFPVAEDEKDLGQIYLIGHSRGGATSLIYAADDPRVKRVCGWAALCSLENRWPEHVLAEWKKNGVIFIPNSRTGQDMPMKYSIVEDYYTNQERLDIPARLASIGKPVLLIHGTADETVPLVETEAVVQGWDHIRLKKIEGADHVFGGQHPFTGSQLPEHTRELVRETIEFFR